jgi:hypothetical protein
VRQADTQLQLKCHGAGKQLVGTRDALRKGRLEAGPKGDTPAQKEKLGRALLHTVHCFLGGSFPTLPLADTACCYGAISDI